MSLFLLACACVCPTKTTVFRPHYTGHHAKAIRQSYAYHQLRSCTAVSSLIIHPTAERCRMKEMQCRTWTEEEVVDYKWKRGWECHSAPNTGWTSADVRDREREREQKKRSCRRHWMRLRKVNRTDWQWECKMKTWVGGKRGGEQKWGEKVECVSVSSSGCFSSFSAFSPAACEDKTSQTVVCGGCLSSCCKLWWTCCLRMDVHRKTGGWNEEYVSKTS